MGIFDGMQALKAVQGLKAGKPARLSIAQITDLLVNLPDAQKNLSKEENDALWIYYQIAKKDKQKIDIPDINEYYRIAVQLIKYFDKVAPYEKYSGNYSPEFRLLVDAIRAGELDDIPSDVWLPL